MPALGLHMAELEKTTLHSSQATVRENLQCNSSCSQTSIDELISYAEKKKFNYMLLCISNN